MAGEAEATLTVLAINGSPRATDGMTDRIVQRFLAGAREAGALTETVYPAKLKLAPCVGCLRCWFRTPGVCRHKDAMPELMEKLRGADIVVFASPVYVDGMTAQMKSVFDRMVTYTPPFFEYVGHRSYHPLISEQTFKVVAVSACGFPERLHFDPISLHFQRICENMRVPLLGEIYFPASSLLASEPERASANLDAVQRAGREAAREGAISSETLAAANADYVGDPRVFDDQVNEIFRLLRRHHGVK